MDFRQVVYPFHIVSRLLGFTYFDLRPKTDTVDCCPTEDPPKPPQHSSMWTCLKRSFVVVYLFSMCCNVLLNVRQIFFVKYFARDVFSTLTGQRLSSGLFMCSSVMFILSMLYSAYFRGEARLIIDKFVQFDEIYQTTFGGGIDHANHRRRVIAWTGLTASLAWILVPSSFLLQDRFSNTFTIEFLLCSHINILNYAYLQSHVVLFAGAVLVRFRAINRELRTIFDGPGRGAVGRVQRCRVLHDTLNDIVELINLCFAFHAMWCTMACFGFCLMSLYSNYEAFTRKEQSWNMVCVNLAWNAFYMFYSTAIVWVASKMRAEANRSTALVHKIINANVEPRLTDELRVFSQQLSHRIPVVSCGLFNFDWGLYYSVIGACGTYLVILIQFNSSSCNKAV